MTEMKRISTIEDLIPLVELTNIQTFEVSGRRRDTPVDSESEESQEMRLLFRESDDELEVRVRLTVQTREAQLMADCAAIFKSIESIKVDEMVKREFMERVGVMSVFPFLRESVFTTAARLQVSAPVLGLIRPGQVSVTPEPGVRQSDRIEE